VHVERWFDIESHPQGFKAAPIQNNIDDWSSAEKRVHREDMSSVVVHLCARNSLKSIRGAGTRY
jgi:hypothetical protein